MVAENKALIVALDDVNYLFHSKNANKIFYDILRAHEAFPGARTGVFAILSDIEFRFALDKNVNSIFIPQEIIFQPYTREELFSILKERTKMGFYPEVISDEILEEIVDKTLESGDLRVGIDLLRVCGNLAESEASRTIDEQHLNEALKRTGPVSLSHTLNSLSENENSLLELIVNFKDENLTAGSLYELFQEKTSTSYSSFNRTLDKLEFLRLIDTKFTGKGMRGNSRLIILRFSQDEINKCMVQP
jgi:cell division control protein 6